MAQRGERRIKPPVGDVRDPDSMYHHLLRYLTYLSERNYSPRTVGNRDMSLRMFIVWCFDRGLTKPRELDRPILERYQRHLFYHRKVNGDPLSAKSQCDRVLAVRHWLQWQVKKGLLLYSPAADLDLPRLERRLPKAILSVKESETVLAVPDVGTTKGLRDRAILETLYSTGMRRMELVGLNVHDLDFERGTVMIRQGKGKKDRMIPIGERALAWISAYRDRARPELVVGRDDGTLFLTQLGQSLSASWLSIRVAAYVDQAGIGKKGSCHMFRHTMATLMLENGADIRYIQVMLGHADLRTTEIYAQVSVRMLKAIHTATHPGKLTKAGERALDAEPTAKDLLEALEREAEEDGEGEDTLLGNASLSGADSLL
jgi:integrase/recombinase XerD